MGWDGLGWFRLPVVYRLGDGWVALYGVVLSCGCGGGDWWVVIDDAGLGLGWWR